MPDGMPATSSVCITHVPFHSLTQPSSPDDARIVPVTFQDTLHTCAPWWSKWAGWRMSSLVDLELTSVLSMYMCVHVWVHVYSWIIQCVHCACGAYPDGTRWMMSTSLAATASTWYDLQGRVVCIHVHPHPCRVYICTCVHTYLYTHEELTHLPRLGAKATSCTGSYTIPTILWIFCHFLHVHIYCQTHNLQLTCTRHVPGLLCILKHL